MINSREFRIYAHEMADWMANYLQDVEQFAVKPHIEPGEILSQIPETAPEHGEQMADIFNDFKRVILPGMAHWQSPNWFAYFQANSSYASILAEMLTATLGAQCMSWETSPAATELEERVMQWLRDFTGLPESWNGVIQDTASTSTLCALLTAREKASGYTINKSGFSDLNRYRIYASTEAHSSVDKAVRIAGFGTDNLVKINTDDQLSMDTKALEEAINNDVTKGFIPLCVIATIGTTATLAIDPIHVIGKICKQHDIWLHVDAAYAGSSMALPEHRWMIKGIEFADSYVFNPHKWMFTNFDSSAYFVADKEALIRTFSILPEYLKTDVDQQVNNYRDWGIQLGRRFRALKLWFVLRSYGMEGIRQTFRNHIQWVQQMAEEMKKNREFEILAPVLLNMICFRYNPGKEDDPGKLNMLNKKLLDTLNQTGRLFMTHTVIRGNYAIRFVAGQTFMKERHVLDAWQLIRETARQLS